MGWPSPAGSPRSLAVHVSQLTNAPVDAELTGREDLRFVLDREDHSLRCFVGPGVQSFSAALQLGCSLAAWSDGGMLIRGAGLALEEVGAVAALAVSGGGKSTLSNLAEGFLGLSDETLLLWATAAPRLSATPFRSSSHREPQPRTEPLRAFLVLEKSLEPRYERLPEHEGMKRLLAQAYQLPPSIASRADLFARCSWLAREVPTYRFAFPKSPEAAGLLRRFFEEELSRSSA
jgi:hypothetical protein